MAIELTEQTVRTPAWRARRTAETPACTATAHGTVYAFKHRGCTCPSAKERSRIYRKRMGLGRLQPALVDGTGTRRRMRALCAIGWGPAALAGELGWSGRSSVTGLTGGAYQRVSIRTEQAVRALYERLSMTPGPSERARTMARRRGWPPPLAWDEGDIDNPDAVAYLGQPTSSKDIDWGSVNMVVRYGERMRLTTLPERWEAARLLLADPDLTMRAIADRIGVSEAWVQKWFERRWSEIEPLLTDQTLTLDAIAERAGISEDVLQRWAQRKGLDLSGRARRRRVAGRTRERTEP